MPNNNKVASSFCTCELRQTVPDFHVSGVTVKVYNVDLAARKVDAPVTLRAYLTQTMEEFKNTVAWKIPGGVNVEHMRCVRERYYNELKLLSGDADRTIKQEGFIKSNKVSK